uniref:AlNc14C20G2119 protein n=1 Tax=Albugo laibachii Nc14 TaxID=890382 RepID=F0W5F3_9STRA|nr:AlNc14C20G2119 [Albugo laibachii Nc14]|eukprot:CCA16344.1 AlNc14C20G2119 [Albugo laibachii Nc14]
MQISMSKSRLSDESIDRMQSMVVSQENEHTDLCRIPLSLAKYIKLLHVVTQSKFMITKSFTTFDRRLLKILSLIKIFLNSFKSSTFSSACYHLTFKVSHTYTFMFQEVLMSNGSD